MTNQISQKELIDMLQDDLYLLEAYHAATVTYIEKLHKKNLKDISNILEEVKRLQKIQYQIFNNIWKWTYKLTPTNNLE